MPKLKKEMFARPVRFTHRFGEGDDPHIMGNGEYFDAPYPTLLKVKGSAGFNGKQKGLSVWTEPFSGVDKFKGGKASLSGPKPDIADETVERPPVSTQRRKVSGGGAK